MNDRSIAAINSVVPISQATDTNMVASRHKVNSTPIRRVPMRVVACKTKYFSPLPNRLGVRSWRPQKAPGSPPRRSRIGYDCVFYSVRLKHRWNGLYSTPHDSASSRNAFPRTSEIIPYTHPKIQRRVANEPVGPIAQSASG